MEQPTERELKAIRLMVELKNAKKEASKRWDILYESYIKTPEYKSYAEMSKRVSEIEEELRDMT